jgi:hypothetical protein
MTDEAVEPQPKSAKQVRAEETRRIQAERAAEDKRLADEERVRQVKAKEAFDHIWRTFGRNRKKSKGKAFANLLQDITEHASELVPYYMTAKEFVSIIAEIETHTKGDEQSQSADPKELVASWLRGDGDVDLSRVPLEKIQ